MPVQGIVFQDADRARGTQRRSVRLEPHAGLDAGRSLQRTADAEPIPRDEDMPPTRGQEVPFGKSLPPPGAASRLSDHVFETASQLGTLPPCRRVRFMFA